MDFTLRITLDEKYVVTKKLMLLYGSQHLSSSSGGLFSRLNKTTMGGNSLLDTKIDSLVVTGSLISKKVFTNLQSMIGSSLNLGNLIITLSAPSAPTLKSPTNGEIHVFPSVTFLWNPSDGSTSYTFQLSTSSSFNSLFYSQGGLTNTSLQISGLSINTTYYWRVNATNIYGTSSWSNIFSFNTIGPPQAPSLVSPTNNATEVILSPTLTWNAASNAVSYALQVSTSNSFSNFVYNQDGLANTSQLISSLLSNTTYYWRVNATNNYGTSGWSTAFTFKTVIPPQAPTLLAPTNNATGISVSPTLSWNTVSNATSYTLQISTSSSFTSLVYNQSSLTNTSQQISGLGYSTTYYWRVYATNSYGNSEQSNAWSFITICIPMVIYQGKTYNTVQIGTQCWLKENLNVGTKIQVNNISTNNGIIEKYCYNDDENNCNTYGGLYQWNEAMAYNTTPGSKGICPDGWHIPTNSEFQTLSTAVGNNGNSLKALGQGNGIGSGTNSSGFSGLLSGGRGNSNLYFDLSWSGLFWSSSEGINTTVAFMLKLWYDISNITISNSAIYKEYGMSVRCIND